MTEKICMNCRYSPERELWQVSFSCMCKKGCGWVHENDSYNRFKIKKELKARRRYKFVER